MESLDVTVIAEQRAGLASLAERRGWSLDTAMDISLLVAGVIQEAQREHSADSKRCTGKTIGGMFTFHKVASQKDGPPTRQIFSVSLEAMRLVNTLADAKGISRNEAVKELLNVSGMCLLTVPADSTHIVIELRKDGRPIPENSKVKIKIPPVT